MKNVLAKNGLKFALVAGGVLALVPVVHAHYGENALDELLVGTPQQIERGDEVFERQCAECHGEAGEGATEIGEQLGAEGFVDVEVDHSGLYTIYHLITPGLEHEELPEHASFDGLRYQDRWAVAHYTHRLVDDPQPDHPDVVEEVRSAAAEGICEPEILEEEVEQFAGPEDQDQIDRGEEVYTEHCVACHGEDGRLEAGGARDFHDPVDEWIAGSSPFDIFNAATQGIGDMAAIDITEDEGWAVAHYMREEFLPEENVEPVDELAICRALSRPPKPDPIPVEQARRFLIEDADQQRYRQLRHYGDPIVIGNPEVTAEAGGEELFEQNCAGCHGANGTPDDAIGPYGKFPPYMMVEPAPLEPASAGGTYQDFAQRVVVDTHASLPDRPGVAALSDHDWQQLHAWVAGLDSELVEVERHTVANLEEARELIDDEPFVDIADPEELEDEEDEPDEDEEDEPDEDEEDEPDEDEEGHDEEQPQNDEETDEE